MDYSDKDLSARHLLERMFSWETSALWNRMIKAALITRYRLSFPRDLKLAEDCVFLACLLNRSLINGDSLRIIHIDDALVHYDNITNPHSLTRPSNRAKDLYFLHDKSYLLLQDELDMSIFGTSFYSFITSFAFLAFWRAQKDGLERDDYARLFQPFKNGIKRYGPKTIGRFLVLLSLKIGIDRALLFRWLALPSILSDKIRSKI